MHRRVRGFLLGALSSLVLGICPGCSEEDCDTRCDRTCVARGLPYTGGSCGPSGECNCVHLERDADREDGRDGDDAGATDSETSSGDDTGESAGDVEAGDADAAGDADVTPRTWSFDLDGDGTNDTDLAVAPCAAEPAASCLVVTSAVVTDRGIRLGTGFDSCTGSLMGERIRVLGDFGGDALLEVSVAWCPNDGTRGNPALAVIDVSASLVLGSTAAPSDHANAWIDHPRDPAGRLHPFLAPSYGDGDTSGFYGSTIWGRLCVWRPDLASDPLCGTGFAAAGAMPAASFFREVGGTVQDLDGDGWEDVTLLYHSTAHTISPASLGVLATTVYDVAASTEPGSPALFHSGRNYGTHAAVTGADGMLRTVIAGGAPVGSFTDVNCNVTRFVAVLETPPGSPAARRLAWSSYFGFASTIFSAYDPAYAADPSVVVARPADVMNRCIHRFSDSRAVMDGEEVVVFDYFLQDAPVSACLWEQYQLYIPPAWTAEKQLVWNECFASNLGAPGVWGMQVRAERDGGSRTGSLNTYVWGRATTLRPGGETLYLVELLPGSGRFDLADRAPTPLVVYALVAGLWTDRGAFPVAGRVKLRHEAARGARGVGSYTAFEELTLEDVDGDGLDDVQLADDRWVGWSAAAAAFVVK